MYSPQSPNWLARTASFAVPVRAWDTDLPISRPTTEHCIGVSPNPMRAYTLSLYCQGLPARIDARDADVAALDLHLCTASTRIGSELQQMTRHDTLHGLHAMESFLASNHRHELLLLRAELGEYARLSTAGKVMLNICTDVRKEHPLKSGPNSMQGINVISRYRLKGDHYRSSNMSSLRPHLGKRPWTVGSKQYRKIFFWDSRCWEALHDAVDDRSSYWSAAWIYSRWAENYEASICLDTPSAVSQLFSNETAEV